MNKNNLYYRPGAKTLNLSKRNRKYYEIINNTPMPMDIPQKENTFFKSEQNLETIIFMFCFGLWQILSFLL